MTPKKVKYYHIGSLEKGFRVLELLADHEALTVTEAARLSGLNRASSHRFLAHLADLGYVEKGQDNRYRLTLRLLELGYKAANRDDICRLARGFMEELFLPFRETVNLGFFNGLDILHLDKMDSLEILRLDVPIGSRAPAYCTGLGKAILAEMADEELAAYLDHVTLTPHGPKTILSPERLREELARTRRRGYAVDDEELSPGLRCVAAAVFDYTGRARYALSVSGPTTRMTLGRLDEIQPRIRDVCARLSLKMGHRSASGETNA
jgi:DNA-binding IclR family transcriptional regulator